MASISPLRDKLVQIEHDTFDAACSAGKGYVEARYEATLAVKQYEEQALARQAELAELTDLLKRVDHLWHERRKMWCRESDSTWFVMSDRGVYLYEGPSTLAALRVLVEGKK